MAGPNGIPVNTILFLGHLVAYWEEQRILGSPNTISDLGQFTLPLWARSLVSKY